MSKLMTIDEVAEYLKLSKETLYKKVRKKEIPAIKIGRLWRFRKEVIEKWIEEKAKSLPEKRKKRKKIKLKTYRLGVIGTLSRREIYEGR